METPEQASIAVELTVGGEPLWLRWDPGLPAPSGEGDDAAASPWNLDGEPDWERLDGVRLVSARFEDGRALALAAARPRGAKGHDEDQVVAKLVGPDGEETPIDEALLSVEYDPDGEVRRLGVELWTESGSPPLRVAADRDAEVDPGAPSARHAVPMTFRLDGGHGVGLHELLRPVER
jgi:hypothetical protein